MQTGPRTAEGKAASSMNAMSHGLTSSKVVLPGEDAAAYERLLKCLMEDHRPGSATEALLIEEMAQAHWRLNRVRFRQDSAFESPILDSKLLALLHRYATAYERAFFKALETLKKLQRERKAPSQPTFVSQKQRDPAFEHFLKAMAAQGTPSTPDSSAPITPEAAAQDTDLISRAS